ncbi:alpha/beta hydrolase [Actinoplanes sp. NPDC048796]|uniref:alpha/beta hydrolase n=1 Tax=Actinoplanes sp. NPDC048796 TaxID=3155640 RepID=UPI0033F842FE
MWLHASSWQPWIDLFEERGYPATAPGRPGDAATVEPILIGHSFGGLIAQKLLGAGLGAATVAIDAAQIEVVLPLPLSALRSGFPVLGNPTKSIPAPGKPLFEAAAANFNPHSPAEVATANESRGPLLLIWFEWHEIMPALAARYTVVAPDLPGAGESDAPAGGYDKKTMAAKIHGLLVSQGLNRDIRLVGHDIGTMVAYAYAAAHPAEVKRLVRSEAPIPDESIYSFPALSTDGPGPLAVRVLPAVQRHSRADGERPRGAVGCRCSTSAPTTASRTSSPSRSRATPPASPP